MCGIDLSLNLGLLGYPSQYVIVSYTLEAYDEDSVFCKVVDVTDPIIIPPPDFSISTFSSTIALLPAESKIAELQVKSNTNLQSYVLLSTGTNSNVKLSFEPNKLYVPPSQFHCVGKTSTECIRNYKRLPNIKLSSYNFYTYHRNYRC